jgi:type I restriction enzyme S subunit
MVKGNHQLPDGWTWKTIGEVTLPVEKVDPTQNPNREFTYLDIASIDNSIHQITDPESYYGSDAPSRARQLVQTNDVLFSTVRTYLKKIAQVPEIYDGQIASTGFSVLRANAAVLPEYLFYYSLTQQFLEPLNELQRGTSYPAVRDSDVRVQMIPIAPLPEQERIVAKIEELFTQLEAGTSALAKVQAGLRRYKASVLKAAVEGRLVNGNSGIGEGGLPEGWQWVKLGELISDGPTNGLYLPKDRYGTGTPILRIDDYQNDYSKPSADLRLVSAKSSEIEKYSLSENDLIINRVNSPSHLGKCIVISQRNLPSLFESNMMRIRFSTDIAHPKYVELYLHSNDGKKRLISNAKWAVNQASINQQDVISTPVPLPPLQEQLRIVAEAERRLSVARQVESSVEEALVRASRLRQAILRSAFEGRLT